LRQSEDGWPHIAIAARKLNRQKAAFASLLQEFDGNRLAADAGFALPCAGFCR
jgi:hypothetical protein